MRVTEVVVCTYIVMFAGDLRPTSLENIVSPGYELPVQFFVECSEETQNFDHVKRGFGVEVDSRKLIYEIINQRLHAPRIFVEESILRQCLEKYV